MLRATCWAPASGCLPLGLSSILQTPEHGCKTVSDTTCLTNDQAPRTLIRTTVWFAGTNATCKCRTPCSKILRISRWPDWSVNWAQGSSKHRSHGPEATLSHHCLTDAQIHGTDGSVARKEFWAGLWLALTLTSSHLSCARGSLGRWPSILQHFWLRRCEDSGLTLHCLLCMRNPVSQPSFNSSDTWIH